MIETTPAVVLAGDRGPDDPLRRAAGVAAKSLTICQGEPLVVRTVSALLAARRIARVVLCGPEEETLESLGPLFDDPRVSWTPPGPTPCASAAAGVLACGQGPVLITTADLGLPSPETFDRFVDAALVADADFSFGVADHSRVVASHPGLPKTAHRLRDGAYCGCNLFLVKRRAGRALLEFWRRVESARKEPWRAAGAIGLSFLLKYLLRLVTLDEAAAEVGKRAGATVAPIRLPPDAALDVDTPRDLAYVDAIRLAGPLDGAGMRSTRDPRHAESRGREGGRGPGASGQRLNDSPR